MKKNSLYIYRQGHTIFHYFQVNSNGVISFRNPFFDLFINRFPLLTNDVLIAAFWDGVNTFFGGQVFFRQTNDENLLTQVASTVESAFMVDFSPTLLFIVTWDGVPGPINTVCLLN